MCVFPSIDVVFAATSLGGSSAGALAAEIPSLFAGGDEEPTSCEHTGTTGGKSGHADCETECDGGEHLRGDNASGGQIAIVVAAVAGVVALVAVLGAVVHRRKSRPAPSMVPAVPVVATSTSSDPESSPEAKPEMHGVGEGHV